MADGLIKLRSSEVCTVCHDVPEDKRLVRGDVRNADGSLIERHEDGSMPDGCVNCLSGRWWIKRARQADVMVVGEAPGGQEELHGRVFCGEAGRELDTWLRSAELQNRAIWLDNAVRCRPQAGDLGKDTDQRRKKITVNCLPYLAAEIARLKPRVIIPLGNVALNKILRVSGIGKWHGLKIPSREYDCWVLPIYHPAAIIRDRSVHRGRRTREIIKLLHTVPGMIDKPPRFSKVHWMLVNTPAQFDRMMDHLEKAEDVASDYETVGFIAREGRTICINLSDGKIGYCVALMSHDGQRWLGEEKRLWLKTGRKYEEHPERFERLRRLLEDRENIQHNSGFDLQWSLRRGFRLPERVHDTEVVDSILHRESDNDLKGMALRRTDAGFYDDGLGEYLNKGDNYDVIPVLVLSEYGAKDALYTCKIKRQHVREMKTHPAAELVDYYNRLCVIVAQMEHDGIASDQEYASGLIKTYTARLKRTDARIRKTLGIENPASNDQLFAAFYGEDSRGGFFERSEFSGIRKLAVDRHVLGRIRRTVPRAKRKIIDDVLERRHLEKFIGTFLTMFASKASIHPHYSLHVPTTGRPSMKNPNLLNLPRGPDVRNCWIVRPGNVLVEMDYKQTEMMLAGEYSGDENMLAIFERNGDIHCFVGHNSIKKNGRQQPEEAFKGGENRARAKILGFSVIYGKTAMTLSEEMGVSEQDAQVMIDLLKSTAFPRLGEWIRYQENLVLEQGYVDTLFGRRIPVLGWDSDLPGKRNGAMRKAVNYPIQSAAGDVTAIGIVRVAERLKKENFPAPDGFLGCPRLTIYDSLISEVPEKHVGDYVALAREEMEAPIRQITRVRMRVDVKVGYRWGELKEVA